MGRPRPVAFPLAAVLLVALVAACTSTGPSAPRSASGPVPREEAAPRSSVPRGTLKIAWDLEPSYLNPKMTTGSGVGEFMWPFNSFLTYYDFHGVSHPMLARAIPTQENGDWIVNPDGTMVTIYRLRENARWHDGKPITAHDIVFSHEVYTDPELPVVHREPAQLLSAVEARDAHTLILGWKQPYLRANQLGYRELNPIPRHVFEEKYRTNRTMFLAADEWTSAYVGSGPFRVESWSPGVGLIARAFPDWVLGPPKLETLDIRFILDHNTLLANLLSGEVDLISSPGVRANEAVIARDQWVARGEGYLRTWETRLSFMEFQYRDVPGRQRVLDDIRARQALMHAINRQGLVDTVNEGLGSIADAFVVPSDPLFPEIDRAIAKYPFDPNRASSLLADAGWRRAGTGSVVGTGGQALDLEIMGSAGQANAVAIIADSWKAVGVEPVQNILAAARQRDREYRAHFPGTQLNGRSISMENFHFVSGQLPRAETGWVELNRGTFYDAEVEGLHTLALTSFDAEERRRATVGFQERMSRLAAYAPLYYSVEVILAKHKVKGPIGNYGPQIGITWNIFEWEVTE